MSPRLNREVLAGVTRSVLETAVFLFCDEVPVSAEPLGGEVIEAVIRFEAPTSGQLCLRFPRSLGRDAAANLLGVERDDPDAEEGASAAVAELLNMVCGAALEAWFGAQARWALGVPVTTEFTGRLPTGRPESVAFVVDETPVEIEVTELGGSS